MTQDPMIAGLFPPQRGVVACWMTGLALAMRCKLGEADDAGMANARMMVAVLPDGDPLRAAVLDLDRQWPHLRRPHQSDALKAVGEKLLRAVERSSWPSPSNRSDIEG